MHFTHTNKNGEFYISGNIQTQEFYDCELMIKHV